MHTTIKGWGEKRNVYVCSIHRLYN